ncbi:exodeoxyribonuclease III [Caulobacter endophyticus]|uniref:exodeoxyribonuclease III n=1 Tax=Caulobacter endophyticus TaxID=2172652 RepID=UPI00240FB274|nr:exodeoxyribonuclease III [Caulobacter endophyticus]MDG2528045.1 exodeoxyribonuclease III [Caulobacter endophyticus]
MRIATYNINNVGSRLDNLLDWLAEAEPDVVCLQELKAEQSRFPAEPLEQIGYGAVWKGQRTWNGVAILARGMTPVLTRTALPSDPDPGQARYIVAAVNGVLVGCLYLPNGNPAPGPNFTYKLAWFDSLLSHARALLDSGAPVVLAGDYNVVPTKADIYPKNSYGGDALLRPETREAFSRLLDQGWTDALREAHPMAPPYTYWSYLRERWPKDKGLRIDHLLLSPRLADVLVDAGVDRWVRGQDKASDHAPAWILLNP